MTVEEMCAIAEKVEFSYDSFKAIEPKRSKRRDLHAMLLLDELVPGECGIISCAEHDEIWFDTEPEALAKVVNEDQIAELVKCGVCFSDDSLSMFK